MKKKYYITTPIYYPNDKLHLGHCYTTILCDIFKKYQMQIMGNDCLFLTGSDEHGQKIAKTAISVNSTPLEYVDKIVKTFKDLWKVLNIDYDIFIRTTDKKHIETAQLVFEKLLQDKYIYLDKYQTNYCEACEEAFTNSELVDGCCPRCGKKTILIDEESYFLKCSQFKTFIEEVLNENLIDIIPGNKKNEMINNFISNLHDLSISRTEVKWAIPVKSNPSHTIYVWLDALLNYISSLNYLGKNDQLFNQYWSNDCQKIHIIGKEISRFHIIYWPIILKALNLELPNKIIAHGWIVAEDNQKMSKSLNNYINPLEIIKLHNNSDVLRYYLAKISKIGDDFYFNLEHYMQTYNNDLANNVGNLVSRVFNMVIKYYNSYFDKAILSKQEDILVIYKYQTKLINHYVKNMEQFSYKETMEEIMELIGYCNKLIEENKPWTLFKEGKNIQLNELMTCLITSTFLVMYLLSPFIPNSYQKYQTFFKFKINISLETFNNLNNFNGIQIMQIIPLFIRKLS